MLLLKEPTLSPPSNCPYIKGEEFTQEYFFAKNLAQEELDILLQNGWRKFGIYFFRPKCSMCSKCLPLRVLVKDFDFSKKQRRLLRKNSDVVIRKEPHEFKEEYYSIYLKHSKRFNNQDDKVESRDDFRDGFFSQSCSSFLLTYYLDGKMIAWGLLDEGEQGLSSVYFAFDPDYSKRSLGNFGALIEIDYAKKNSFRYYYLGYYIETNPSMSYKASYRPHEVLNWSLRKWETPL